MEDYLFGRKPVEEAIKAGRPINKAWLLDKRQTGNRNQTLDELEDLLQTTGVVINYTTRQALDRMVKGANHQGVVIQVAARDYVDSREFLAELIAAGKDPFIFILDELQDGHNLGACMRVADAAGVDLIVIPERRSASLDQFVAKASAGAIEYVPVAREVNLSRFVMDLQKQGFWIYGADGEADAIFTDLEYTGKVALVIGNEGKGISQKLREHCDFLIKIPMYGKINSLNASVACGIIGMEMARQLQESQ